MGLLVGVVGDCIGIVGFGGMGVGINGCGDGLLSGSCVEGYGFENVWSLSFPLNSSKLSCFCFLIVENRTEKCSCTCYFKPTTDAKLCTLSGQHVSTLWVSIYRSVYMGLAIKKE